MWILLSLHVTYLILSIKILDDTHWISSIGRKSWCKNVLKNVTIKGVPRPTPWQESLWGTKIERKSCGTWSVFGCCKFKGIVNVKVQTYCDSSMSSLMN